jgi:hypothetical protein
LLTELILACSQARSAQSAQGAAPASEIPLSMHVNRAIALGVDYLRGLQRGDGSFAGHEQHPGGTTALVAFTLLRSGVRRNDPVLTRALAALGEVEFETTYSASVHLLLCEALREPARAVEAERSLAFLLARQRDGGWAYPWGNPDNSNTQFALLGLRAARRMGLEVPEEAWLAAAGGLEVFRHESGGLQYTPQLREAYAGITAAGLASLAVLQEVAADSARLRAVLPRESDWREKAERWLEARWDPARNHFDNGTWSPWAHFAYLWAVERWCGLTGRERLGAHDWYGEGAAWLVDVQARDGSFSDRGLEDTCFALLFLRRATVSESTELSEIYAEIERLRAERPARFRRAGPDAVRLTAWWLAGPWERKGERPLLLDPPLDPAVAKPRARGKIAGREWERVDLERGRWTDLDKVSGRDGDGRLWVLSTWLSVPEGPRAEALEAILWLELEDGWDVWLDGKRLSRERRRRAGLVADVGLELALAPGEHLLTVLVEDLRGPAAFGALVTSRTNGAPQGGLAERAESAR